MINHDGQGFKYYVIFLHIFYTECPKIREENEQL